jgi:SAM-dependent methyltransferase
VATVDRANPAYAGQSAYTHGFLAIYDAVVYRFNTPVLWRCSRERFVAHYDANVSGRHLDVGVATGALLDQCRFPVAEPELTLMDLNPNSLAFAARRLARYGPLTHQANVLGPWQLDPASFDSVGMTNLLHCLPGAMPQKAVAFEQARRALAPNGVLFGATILGRGVDHHLVARAVLAAMNRRGVLSNREDDLAGLQNSLAEHFCEHSIEVVGTVAFFSARA